MVAIFLHPCRHLFLSVFLITAVLVGVKWNLIVDFVCISPMMLTLDLCLLTENFRCDPQILCLVLGQHVKKVASIAALLVFRIYIKQLLFSHCHVWLFATPWTAACQASLSITNSQILLKLMSVESVMPSSHLILCFPLLLLPPIFPSIRFFSSESTLYIRWPKY